MSFYICLYQEGIYGYSPFLQRAISNNYNAVATSINANMLPFEPHESDPTYPGTAAAATDWNSKVILVLSDVAVDSRNAKLRENAKKMMLRDITWANHLQNFGSVMVRLEGDENTNLAEIIKNNMKGYWFINVPITNPELASFEHHQDVTESQMCEAQDVDTWTWWNNLRFGVDHNCKVKVVLELNDSDRPSQETVRRWLGEPIEAIIVPSTLFVINRSNYYVLKKEWQIIVAHFINARANIIISTNPKDQAISQYAEYIKKLYADHCDIHSLNSFENVLEVPLQPLSDNLDSYTYEIFESDPVKYKSYQDAVQQALLDRVSDAEASEKLTVVMVLGGGRGPLARAVFNAAALTNRKVRVYIIEKNPSAIRTLSNMVKTLWANKDVHIFSKDMRDFSPPELADILVSELLGSFGDNELSPECLDCASKLLKSDGISIPCQSTSYINPLMSAAIHSNVVNQNATIPSLNSGYVTLLKNIYHIDEPKVLFDFKHPNLDKVVDNTRYEELSFTAKANCVIHGIGGYFDTVLYKDIKLSINPFTHTKGMFSWFPMYFPLHPRTVKTGDTISIRFWRCVDAKKVWYEWQLSEPTVGELHNVGGEGYSMTL